MSHAFPLKKQEKESGRGSPRASSFAQCVFVVFPVLPGVLFQVCSALASRFPQDSSRKKLLRGRGVALSMVHTIDTKGVLWLFGGGATRSTADSEPFVMVCSSFFAGLNQRVLSYGLGQEEGRQGLRDTLLNVSAAAE